MRIRTKLKKKKVHMLTFYSHSFILFFLFLCHVFLLFFSICSFPFIFFFVSFFFNFFVISPSSSSSSSPSIPTVLDRLSSCHRIWASGEFIGGEVLQLAVFDWVCRLRLPVGIETIVLIGVQLSIDCI